MKLKFKNQDFQEAATAAVCDVFEGQPYHDPNVYTVDPGRGKKFRQDLQDFGGEDNPVNPVNPVKNKIQHQEQFLFEEEPEVGYKNAEIKLPIEVLRENLHKVQNRQNLEHTSLRASASPRELNLPELEVEMETGTGKTFVYTKTIFELNKRFGWSKFIIIVPGIAIREGVKKSLEITADKFLNDYGKSAKVYVYNSAHPQDILDFSTNADIQVIVMNVQAFNARGKDARRIFMELDEFASRRPIDLIAANRPILILDEPQKMEGKATNEMLPKFNPLMILRYSATHRSLRNLVYKLDAIDAFEQKLVKKIEPVCIDVTNRAGVYPYIYCSHIRPGKDGPEAILEFQVQRKTGAIVNETRVVRKGDDLFTLPNKIDAYDFSSKELVKKSIEALDRGLNIPKLTYTVRRAEQTSGGFTAKTHESHRVDEHFTNTDVKYDLLGKIAEGTTLTRKTVSKILSKIETFRFKQFADNPEKFTAECIRIINEQKAAEIVEKIEYHILEETYSSDIFTKNQIVLPSQMSPIRPDGQMLQKHIFDYLTADSAREKEFARDLDTAEEVAVYAKLPGGFSIPTPVGNYNPDWAIAFKAGSVKHVYFVAETKGSMSEMQLREIERQKIACVKKFFTALEKKDTKYHVTYNNVASYADLLSAVGVSKSFNE